MFIQVPVVCVDDDQILHFVQLVVVVHVLQGIGNNVFLLFGLFFGDLHLGHQLSDLARLFKVLCNAAIIEAAGGVTDRSATTHPAPLVRCSPAFGLAKPGIDRAGEGLLILREEVGAHLGELPLPLEIVSQLSPHHESR